MRWAGWWILSVLWIAGVGIYVAGRLPRPSDAPQFAGNTRAMRANEASPEGTAGSARPGWPPWRRTLHGWERADWLPEPPRTLPAVLPRRPALHPLAVAAAEIAAVLAGAWLLGTRPKSRMPTASGPFPCKTPDR